MENVIYRVSHTTKWVPPLLIIYNFSNSTVFLSLQMKEIERTLNGENPNSTKGYRAYRNNF